MLGVPHVGRPGNLPVCLWRRVATQAPPEERSRRKREDFVGRRSDD